MGKPIEWRAIEWRAIANKASWGVYDELGNRICTINTASTRQESTAKLMAQAPALAAEVERLRGLLGRYLSAYPAFRMKPMGAEGSPARIEQENLMALEELAKAALARQEAAK